MSARIVTGAGGLCLLLVAGREGLFAAPGEVAAQARPGQPG